MGIYDRDYYRKEGPSFLGSIATTGQVCKWLVIINVIAYIVQLVTYRADDFSAGPFTGFLAMKPDRVFQHFEIWRLLTGCFLHDPNNWQHIVWNMLFLWWFGKDLEDLYGHKEFLAFYLVSGMLANVFWGLTEFWTRGERFGAGTMGLGASGAVTAVMMLATMHWPFRTILIMFVLPVPLWLWMVLHVGGDLFYFVRGISIGVGVAAHLGGAAFGFLYYKLEWRLLASWSSFVNLMKYRSRPRLRVYREETVASVTSEARGGRVDEQLEAKADAVLEKVQREGLGSLTEEERQILQRASEEYKRRRN